MAPRNSYYYPDGRPKQFTLAGGSAKPVPHKKALKSTSMASVFMPKQQVFAAKTSHAAAAAVVENDAPTPASIPDSQASMWRGLFTSPSVEPGTPDTQVQSREEYEQEASERRRRWVDEAAKRRERWISNSDDEELERAFAAQLDAEQLQTHTQIERDEENHRRSSDQEKRQRPPTAPMNTGGTSAISSPLFIGNSEGNSPEEGEIAEGVNSTSQTFGRMSPPSRVVVPAFGVPQRTSPKAKAQAPVEAEKAKAVTAIVSPARKQPRKQPSIQSISSDDTESLIEPDEGVPAFANSSPGLNYRPKHVKQVSRDRAAQADAVELPYISSDVALTPHTETETQRNQARVDKINAMQEEADPDFDSDEAVEYDADWEGVAGPSHRTRARSKHENDVDFSIPESDVDTGADFPILESDIDPGARPTSAAKRKAKVPSPDVPSAKKKKRSEGPRPGDSGWRFEKLSLKGKQQRQHLIDEMQSEWNATVETVVPDDIRPRWIDGAAIGTAKMPNDWSTELLEALRNFSCQTSGRPQFATQVLRQAVKQQVARYGGGSALYKADVKVAMDMVNKRQVVSEATPLSPDLNTRTREMSLDDRPAAFNMLNRSVSKPTAAANSDRARANSNGSPVAGARLSPSGDEADGEMALDAEPDASLAEVLQRENRSDQTLTTVADQVHIPDAPGLQAGKRKREMQTKLAILDYEEARARKKLVQAELDQISARKKLLNLGIDPDDVL
ncbi:hypothetical protein CKM354_001082800 [Cercospora kikuchii]|uniref:Uncharacterized protein n=1 Tax=Cercospora kikuchii TaxID=84275 RepID=A0A9P3CZL6_9PEZI|nr:uncharacterized protein CKM354_001082800 [Cercospora kikuchii]GIZ47743.1 hypothetical protein CKM354_001082800 [Cercospora kikuchii]